ncbi:MAG: hypothetical protein ACJAXN_001268 [Psychromonas sp.]|jgi:hypothetical protein
MLLKGICLFSISFTDISEYHGSEGFAEYYLNTMVERFMGTGP